MAFLRCRMFLRGDGITLCEGPSGRELWFQGMHCTRPDFKHLNHSTGDCACHSSKCPRFLFVSCSSRHIYHSNTSDVEGSIPAVGALTPRRPSSVWWVSSQRFGERVAEGWPTNLDRNVLQDHTCLNANGIAAGQRFRTSLQVRHMPWSVQASCWSLFGIWHPVHSYPPLKREHPQLRNPQISHQSQVIRRISFAWQLLREFLC